MNSLAAQPAFVAFAVTILVLSLNLLLLWIYSGVVRGKVKTTPNEEDAKANKLVEIESPEVARVLRAHTNAMANTVPFVFLALVFVLGGGSPLVAQVIFGVFAASRIAHSFAYLGGKQPWRSIAFGVGVLATVALVGFIVKGLVTA
jgi:prostaglandin-E synthase 1